MCDKISKCILVVYGISFCQAQAQSGKFNFENHIFPYDAPNNSISVSDSLIEIDHKWMKRRYILCWGNSETDFRFREKQTKNQPAKFVKYNDWKRIVET